MNALKELIVLDSVTDLKELIVLDSVTDLKELIVLDSVTDLKLEKYNISYFVLSLDLLLKNRDWTY